MEHVCDMQIRYEMVSTCNVHLHQYLIKGHI